MEITTIGVERRTAKGGNQVLRLREAGRVPAVLYGAGRDALDLSVDEREFARHVRQHHKVFKLALGGQEQAIWIQDVQWHCLSDRPVHIDFLRIDLDKPMHISIELNYLGHPKGASKGGRLVKDLTEIKVACLPAAIPENIELQVGELDLEEQILASELQLPDGVTLDLPPDSVVCHMPLDTQQDEEELEEGAEGEAAEADAGGDTPSPAE